MPDEEQSEEQSAHGSASTSQSSSGAQATHGSSRSASPLDELENVDDPLAEVADWVRENQTIAMLGAFAIGTFIGALLRD